MMADVGGHERAPAAGAARSQRVARVRDQLPIGTVDRFGAELARGLLAAGVGDRARWLSHDAIEGRLLAPVVVDPDWPEPTPPFPVGSGAVHADLTDDDHEAFARLRSSLRLDAGASPVPDAERLAAAAQEWRLPVTPYRRPDADWAALVARCDQGSTHAAEPSASSGAAPAGDTPLVVDLTALWAGPLATSLLAELGAEVIKVDSDARPDGLREHPAVYRHLNGAKTIIDLDLRTDHGRGHLDRLLARADLLIDSFSRRVLPNLGYGPDQLAQRFPRLRSVGIVAFPRGCPEAEWVSYGPGVHAISGLGHRPDGRCRPAPIAYPDALAGATAFADAAELLSGRRTDRRVERSLAGAVAPLLDRADPS
ncbi:MAG: CoA transferase [Actinomycetota bacterium]